MPDSRRLAPVRWRGPTSGARDTATRDPVSRVEGSRELVISAESITGVTPYRMTLSASTTSSNSVKLPWPGSVVGIGFQGGATGGGTFTVYLDGVASAAVLTWVTASTGDTQTFAAGDIPFDADEVMTVVSSNTQTCDVYAYVTFLS